MEEIQLIATPSTFFESLNIKTGKDVILLVSALSIEPVEFTLSKHTFQDVYKRIKQLNIITCIFIAKEDAFDMAALHTGLSSGSFSSAGKDMTLLIPYLKPPVYEQRDDGVASSFICSFALINKRLWSYITSFRKTAYYITHAYLNSPVSKNISIVQVGKPIAVPAIRKQVAEDTALKKGMIVIPHKGPVKLLKRCLAHLNQEKVSPGKINLCFDDRSYTNVTATDYPSLDKKLDIYLNQPMRVGPYLPRHYSIVNGRCRYVFFQDSDDISLNNRFLIQLTELRQRKLDMIGSHEIRVDELQKEIQIFRYPVDVSKALANPASTHALFHPTSLITKKAYLKAGGFSTDMKFGYDSQFLLRSHFFLKIGNADDFLYIRFKRPNSLTTSPKTKLGSGIRKFMMWRWVTDSNLIRDKKLRMADSSLWVKAHVFDYRMEKI